MEARRSEGRWKGKPLLFRMLPLVILSETTEACICTTSTTNTYHENIGKCVRHMSFCFEVFEKENRKKTSYVKQKRMKTLDDNYGSMISCGPAAQPKADSSRMCGHYEVYFMFGII